MFHLQKFDAHPHVGLGIDHCPKSKKSLVVMRNAHLYGGSRGQGIERVNVTADQA